MRKLSKIQQDVLALLRSHGLWSRGCGWLWDTIGNTQRLMDSLVRAGYATSTDEPGWGDAVYRPIASTKTEPAERPTSTKTEPARPARGRAVLLSGGYVVSGDNVLGMLKRQHAILLGLSRDLAARGYGERSVQQRAIADANLLGLEVSEMVDGPKENKR